MAWIFLAIVAVGIIAILYRADLERAQRRVSKGSLVISTAMGRLEYAVAGSGPRLLMIHGTGGGFDQGLRFSSRLIDRGLTIISPSRFGYLRSDFPAEPTSENQADVLVELLDHLGIDRIVVAGGSAGALPAAQFALRHASRCAGLILLVPAANLSGRDPVEFSNAQRMVVERVLQSDFLFWLGRRLAPASMIGTLLATDPALLDKVSHLERERAFTVLEELAPISARAQGIVSDGDLAGRPTSIDFARIQVPTLIVSTEDDRFGTAATARKIASLVSDTELVLYPSGGHLWLGWDGDVSERIARFVAARTNQ